MVLVTLRASVDGQVLQQVARVVVGEVAIKEPIDLFLSDLDKVFKLRSVHVHSDATWGKPFTDLDLETLDAISAGELAEIGKFLDLVGEARAEPSAATTQKSAFDELKTKLVLPLRSTVDRFDWLIYNALLDRLAADGLGFPPDLIKEGGCGKRLLLALKAQLNYVLPYDSRGVFSVRATPFPPASPALPYMCVALQAHHRVLCRGRRAPATFRSDSS